MDYLLNDHQQVKTYRVLAKSRVTPPPLRKLAKRRGSEILQKAADRGDLEFLIQARPKPMKRLPKC